MVDRVEGLFVYSLDDVIFDLFVLEMEFLFKYDLLDIVGDIDLFGSFFIEVFEY